MAPATDKNKEAAKTTPTTKAVIKRGQRAVVRDEDIQTAKKRLTASTQRALVLRNGKDSIMGTGEVALRGKISGSEKLELIAVDEMEKSKRGKMERLTAVRAPFRLNTLVRWSQAQMDAAIDQVNGLHDVELCYNIVDRHVRSQEPHDPKNTSGPYKDTIRVTSQFGICVHNSYMLASAWTIVHECLREMQRMGLDDKKVLAQLKNSSQIRIIYLLAFDMVKKLVNIGQQRLRSIVQNTQHFAPYFASLADSKDGAMQFNAAELRGMYKSYLDSAIIELCLPGSKFSLQALYQCLHDVEVETPKELKHCPQAMWDAVGDLAEAVRLLDQMETPLLVPEGREWMRELENAEGFQEFYAWKEAQNISVQASQRIEKLEKLINPTSNLNDRGILKDIWKEINSNYIIEGGLDIDHLWMLDLVRNRTPQWTYHWADLHPVEERSDDDTPVNKSVLLSSKDGKAKKRLELTQGGEDDGDASEGSMPDLMDVSDSDDADDEEVDASDNDDSDGEEGDDESGDGDYSDYDADGEEDDKYLFRKAMDMFNENPDIFNPSLPDNDKYAEERKKNPFLKLLGSLKGRIFASSSALRTDGKTTQMAVSNPARPAAKSDSQKIPSKTKTSSALLVDDMPPLEPLTRHLANTGIQDANSKKTTVEDADDESDDQNTDKKKKKKKPKKKKKKPTVNTEDVEGSTVAPQSPPPQSPPQDAVAPLTPPASPTKTNKKKKRTPSIKSTTSSTTINAPSISSSTAAGAYSSTFSLPLPVEQKAESARSYLSSIGVTEKVKVKTRPDQTTEGENTSGRKSLFKKLGFRSKEEKRPPEPKKDDRSANVFLGLKRRSKICAQKLFGVSAADRKGSLKWEQFVALMADLGFDYDPSTAGSSVRFDPPNPNDRSITFHRPHPDPTLFQFHLKDYRAKLMKYYAWSPEQLKMMDNQMGGHSSEID